MQASQTKPVKNSGVSRGAVYVAIVLLSSLGGSFLRRSTWVGTAHLHTTMEVVLTTVALIAGVLALVRYYSKKENIFLFIGTGFISTGFLDGYHALVSALVFTEYFPSPPPSLIPWSGLAARMFLSVLLWLSWAFWRGESRLGASARVPEHRVFFVVNTWTLICLLFFAVVPLPRAYWPVPVFHRPQEFVPVFFSFLALIGYLSKGQWRHDLFEHFLIVSIILFIVHSLYMSCSTRLYDLPYTASHLIRFGAYLCTLASVIIAIYQLIREQQRLLAATTGDRNKDLRQQADRDKQLARRESTQAAPTAAPRPQTSSSTQFIPS